MVNVAQTVQPTTDIRTVDTVSTAQQNLNNAENRLNEADKNYQKALSKELKKTGEDYQTKFEDVTKNKISYQTKKEDKIQNQPKVIPIQEANKNLQEELNERQQAYDQWKIANYQNNLDKVQNEKSTLFDKTLGVPIRAVQDLFSPLTIGEDAIIKDEQGNKTFLPSYSELKQQKVREDTGGIGGIAQDVGYNATKILGAGALDLVTGGIGGKSLYWTDMAADNYKNIKNQGYSNEQAIANTIISTGSEFLTEKLLGGLAGRLTGGQASEVQNIISDSVNKLIKNPKVANIIGSMGSEGLEEFVQEYIGALNNKITLGEDTDIQKLVQDSLYSALIGAGSGGLVTGIDTVQSNIANPNINQNTNNQQIQQQSVANETQVAPQTAPQTEQISEQVQTSPDVVQSNVENNQQNQTTTANEVQTTAENTQSSAENKRIVGNRDFSSEKYNNLSDSDLEVLNKLYDKYKNKEKMTPEEINQMQYLRKKINNVKNPELKTNNTFEDLKSDYGKYYKNNNLDNFNSEILDKAKETIQANKQGKRTKQEWLDVAKNIGMQAENMDSESLKRYAFESFKSAAPNQKSNLNRQGQKYVNFGIDEWVNNVYEGAGVGKKVENNQQQVAKQSENLAEEKAKEPVLKVETTGEKGKQFFEKKGANTEVAKILSETPRKEKPKLKDKIKNAIQQEKENIKQFRREFVDKGQAIEDVDKATKRKGKLYDFYDFAALSDSNAQYQIGDGQTNNEGKLFNNFTDKEGNKVSNSLEGLWKEVDNSGLKDVMDEYLLHYLNTDVYGRPTASSQKDINSILNMVESGFYTPEEGSALVDKSKKIQNVFGESVTKEDSLKRISEIESEHPEIKRLAENIWQYGYNELDKMVDSGRVSKKDAETFKKENSHYVRIQRNVEQKASQNNNDIIEFKNNKGVNVKSGIQERKGGTQDILPLRDSMADFTRFNAKENRLNRFGSQLANVLNTYVEDYNNETGVVDNTATIGEKIRKNDDGTYTLRIYENGKPKQIYINEGIYESLQPNKSYKFENWLPFKITSKASKIQRDLITGKNMLFSLTNIPKDFFNGIFSTKNSIPQFIKNYGKAIPQLLTNGEYAQQYKALGGNQNTYYNYEEGYIKDKSKIKALKAGQSIINGIERINNFGEALPRLSEFMSSIENGKSVEEAMHNAAEVTTNFKRGGNVTKALDRVGANYFNPSVQGTSKFVRNFSEAIENKQYAKILTRVALLGLTPALVGEIMWGDDDEYQDLPQYQKDNYFLFKTGNGNWIRIPKGQIQGALQAPFRRGVAAARGDKDAFKGIVDTFANNVAPNNPLEDNVVGPFISVARNQAWSGNPIVSDYLKNEDFPEDEYTSKTDEFSKWLGKQLHKSPAKINYLLDQYTGGVGDFVLPNITAKANNEKNNGLNIITNPIKDKFTTSTTYSNKSQSDFYDALTHAENAKKHYGTDSEGAIQYKYLNNVSRQIGDLRKKLEKVQSSDKSKEEKYNEAKEIQDKINKMAKDATKKVKNVKKSEYYMQIDNSYYYKQQEDDGTISYKKATDKQIEKNKYALSDYFYKMYQKSKEK